MRLSRRILLFAALLLLFVLPVRAEEAQNLLVNGSFESLDADGLPSGWYVDAYDLREGVTLFRVVEDAHTGSVAAVVENIGENDARFAQRVKVEPNSLYRLSGWIRAGEIVDSGRGANLSVSDLYDACSDSVFESEGGWVYVETYGETGEDQTEVTVFARMGGYSAVSVGSAAFDDLSLVRVEGVPDDVPLKKWYKEEAPVLVQEDDPELIGETTSSFWPWLLFICGVYVMAALWASRWMQANSSTDPRLSRVGEAERSFPPEAIILIAGIALAAVVRLIVAWNIEGYGVDVGCFRAWGYSVRHNGPWNFYGLNGDFALRDAEGANFCDYPPGYLYVLAFNDAVSTLLHVPQYFAHKLVPMTCDLLAALLIWRLAVENGSHRWQATLMALLFALNPATILNSAAWCQVDSSLCFCLMLVAYLAIHRRWAAVLPVYVLAILLKPQALMLGFLGLAAIIMELIRNPKVWKQMVIGVAISLVVALVIVIPFSLNQSSPFWLIDLYGETLSSYPYATVSTTNLFYLFDGNWSSIHKNSAQGVKLFFAVASAAWALCTFLRRRDKRLTFPEPLLTACAAVGAVLTALGLLPLMSGDGGYLLTTGNPWRVFTNADGDYVREFIPGMAGTWSVSIPPVLPLLLGVGLLGLAAVLVYLVKQRREQQEKVCTGLIEPVLMLLFALTFALMLFFDVTWGALGVVSMAMAFAVVLPMFLRSGDLKKLPLCGAVLFVLLFIFGVKMHERYLFPALFLLGMAYAIRRDRRVLWLLIGLSCTLLLNEGIILDNDLRLDSGYVQSDPDSLGLTYVVAFVNVLLGLWSVWLCHSICVEDAPPRLTQTHDEPFSPVRVHEQHPCTPFNVKNGSKVKWNGLDAILIAAVTLLYSIVTLTTLGSTRAPQNPWKSTSAQERVIIDLGQHYDDFSILYFAQVSYSDFTVATSDDGEAWADDRIYWAEMAEGQCFRWKYVVPHYLSGNKRVYPGVTTYDGVQKMSGRFVCITAQQVGLVLNEVIFRDAQGNDIPAMVVGALNANANSPLYSAPENLLDEQNTLEGEPGWWNSTYFDEIYHARTGFEHLNGTTPYETSHPPLGKVIMSWCIGIFGMTPFGWRFAGALCGILMLPAMYLIAKQLTGRTGMGFAAMTLMALDCMHFTQTRIATIDSFPVLFIILSYFFMLRFMQRDIVRDRFVSLLPDLALSGFFMGCGVASKWIGVYAGVGLAVLYFWTCLRQLRIGMECARRKRALWIDSHVVGANGAKPAGEARIAYTQAQLDILDQRDEPAMFRVVLLCLCCLVFFVAVPLAIYLLSYVPYFAYRDLTSPIEYLSLVFKAQEGMLNYHATPGLGMDHPFYSPWYEWPFMQRPMYYAMDSFLPEGQAYAIFCFGNPAVWYVGLAGIAYALYRFLKAHRYRIRGESGTWHLLADTWDIAPAFVLVGLLAQFLPWVLVPRGTYIYHYFASVPFLILGTVLLLNRICKPGSAGGRTLIIVYLGVCLTMFVLLFPYASGVTAPVEWMEFIRTYPWIDDYRYHKITPFVEKLSQLMQAIPLFPNLYH